MKLIEIYMMHITIVLMRSSDADNDHYVAYTCFYYAYDDHSYAHHAAYSEVLFALDATDADHCDVYYCTYY